MELNIKSNANHLDVEIKQVYTTLSVNKKDNFKSTDCVPLLVLDYKTIESSEIKDSYDVIIVPDNTESDLKVDIQQHDMLFNISTSDGTNSFNDDNFIESSISTGSDIISSVSAVTSCFAGKGGLKMSSGSRNGQFTLNLQDFVYKIEIEAIPFGNDSSILSVNGVQSPITGSILSFDINSNVVDVKSTKRCYIKSMKFYIGVMQDTETVSYEYHKDINKDGWFTVFGLIIPTKNWYINNKLLADKSYTYTIYTENGKYYKIVAGEEVEITNIEDLLLPNYTDSTIDRIEQDKVSIWFLRNCYINLCKQIFENRGFSRCWNKNTIDSELVYKRDLVWMAINVIKYLTEFEQLSEVQRIIQNINGCNGLCSQQDIPKYSSGCGCSR